MAFSSTAASVIVTPNSMVRMIVSATTDGGQPVTSAKGHLGGFGEAACRSLNRHPPRPHLSSTTRTPAPDILQLPLHSHFRRAHKLHSSTRRDPPTRVRHRRAQKTPAIEIRAPQVKGQPPIDTITIEREHRCSLRATKHSDGSIIVRAGRSWVQFSADDLNELHAFASGIPTIQRYPVPAPESPQADE